jgi:hypothetical protein
MAESITFDFLSRGASGLQRDLKGVGDNSALASRGAKVLADTIERLGKKEDRTAEESLALAKALRLTGDAEDRAAAKALTAEASIKRLDDQLKQTNKDASNSRGSIKGLADSVVGFGDASKAADSKGTLFARALGGIGLASGLAEPAMAALVGTGGALAAGFTAAAAGAVAYGAALRPLITQTSAAMQAEQQLVKARAAAQASYSAALKAGTSQQTAAAARTRALATAQAAYTQAVKGTPPVVIAFSKAVTDTQHSYTSWADSLAKPVLTPLTAGLKLVNPLLHDLTPFVKAAAGAFTDLENEAGAALQSSGFKDFLKTILPNVEPILTDVGQSIGHVIVGLGGILKAFVPMSVGVFDGLDAITARFEKWGTTIQSHNGFKDLISSWKNNWPLMRTGLERFAVILKNIGGDIFGLSTPSNSKALWQVANPILAVAERLSSHPEFVDALLYLLAIGKAGSQISGVFASLKSGWGALAGIVAKLTGGKLLLGGGAGAAAEIEGAFRTGGAAAAEEIRIALAGGAATGAAAGGEAAAGGGIAGVIKGKGLLWGTLLAGAFIAAVNAKLPSVHKSIWQMGDPPGPGQRQTWYNSWSGLGDAIVHNFGKGFSDMGSVFTNPFLRAEPRVKSQLGVMEGDIAGAKSNIAKNWSVLHGALVDPFANSVHPNQVSLRTMESDVYAAKGDIAKRWAPLYGDFISPFNSAKRQNAASLRTMEGDVYSAKQRINRDWASLHGKTVTVGVDLKSYIPNHIKQPGFAAGALVPGHGNSDTVPAMLTPGEAVVPKRLVPAVAPFLAANKVPGFASGGLVHFAPPVGSFLHNFNAAFSRTEDRVAQIARQMYSVFAGFGGGSGGSGGAVEALARRMFPWPASQWPPFTYVENREAGWNIHATNPTSGAYGLAQFINGPSEYYQWGGNPNSAAGQLAGMFNYIRSRYVTPAAAAAHEAAFNWYGGGLDGVFNKRTLIGVGDGGPERVRVEPLRPGHRGGGGTVNINVRIEPGAVLASHDPAVIGRHLGKYIAAHVEQVGGGDVQLAFGRPA